MSRREVIRTVHTDSLAMAELDNLRVYLLYTAAVYRPSLLLVTLKTTAPIRCYCRCLTRLGRQGRYVPASLQADTDDMGHELYMGTRNELTVKMFFFFFLSYLLFFLPMH